MKIAMRTVSGPVEPGHGKDFNIVARVDVGLGQIGRVVDDGPVTAGLDALLCGVGASDHSFEFSIDGETVDTVPRTTSAEIHSHGVGRQPLVGMLWRVKTHAADQILLDAIADPNATLEACEGSRRPASSSKRSRASPVAR